MIKYVLMQLYIIRHAQSANNALADQRDRVHDPRLTELGWRQAEILAVHLADGMSRAPVRNEQRGINSAGYGITRLYCSPMLRALETARPVGRALGLRPEIWIDIHEYGGIWLDHGDGAGIVGYPGMTRHELQAGFPDYILPETLTDKGWWLGGHEEYGACLARAARVAETLRSWATTDERIAIITHGAFTNVLLNTLLEVSRAQPVSYHHDNAAISSIEFRREGTLSIRYLNRLDYLPPEWITA